MDASVAVATAQLVGNSPTATDALSALSGDLTLSISFAVANEVLEAAKEAEVGEAELIGIVLAVSIILSALPNLLWLARTEVSAAWAVMHRRKPAVRADEASSAPSGLMAFLAYILRVAQRLSMSICVQLIASNVRTQQPLRAARVITLAGVAVFFVFLESTATLGRTQRRR